MTTEEQRLQQDRDSLRDSSASPTAYWKRWGSYLSDRQWGTVREDYSPYGNAWDYFPHEQARSRAYRWGEDGIAGISDNHQRLCFAIALWNEQDPILKERFFGLTGNEGNHGEDVKEYYFYLDNTPTHSYMKCLYKYPQQAFPYTQLVEENRRRDKQQPEFELLDTGVFEENRYFDVAIEYAKNTPEDILIQISITNRSSEVKPLHLLPTLWFRNTWSWNGETEKPVLKIAQTTSSFQVIEASHPTLGDRWLYCEHQPELLFTENETNYQRVFNSANKTAYVKDGINDYIVNDTKDTVNSNCIGTKSSAHYTRQLPPGETWVIRLRLSDIPPTPRELNDEASSGFPSNQVAKRPLVSPFPRGTEGGSFQGVERGSPFGEEFEAIVNQRITEANEFYDRITPFPMNSDRRNIQRQAFAGMLWSKQYYNYVVHDWLNGDPGQPPPPSERKQGRNHNWIRLFSDDILSMPDKWEYPWFAAWDLAFHLIPLAMLDPDFAKHQLERLTREWYMQANGQLPAYEWAFGDVNPPVQAWAAMRIYQIECKLYGRSDSQFLKRVFQKLLMNFVWWVNRKDMEGNNVFQGGFLGLDNIGVFDRSAELPTGGYLNQADGTSWMGMYSLNMLVIALELAKQDPTYEDIASKFFEHFLYIADAIDGIGDAKISLWDETDGFYYDALHLPDGRQFPLKLRSMVGLIPLFAVATLELDTLAQFPNFKKRMNWFIRNRPDLKENVACMETPGMGARRLLAIAYRSKLQRILSYMLDESEFLSPYGIRALSKVHETNPYSLRLDGHEFQVKYEPAESTTGLFGGNSNWRGPIWFPVNYLIIESLQKFHYYFGDDFKVECPTGSGKYLTLWEVANEISQRLMKIFDRDDSQQRPVYGNLEKFQADEHWRDLILFHEYFHGDTGAGLGASHQTGWTGLIAKLIQQCAEYSGN